MDLIGIRKEVNRLSDKETRTRALIADKTRIVYAHRDTGGVKSDVVLLITPKGVLIPAGLGDLTDSEAKGLRDALIKIYGTE